MVNPYDSRTWSRYLESKRLGLLEAGFHSSSSTGTLKLAFLYERVCKLLPGSFKFWKEYLELLEESTMPAEVIIGAFERALNALHRMPRIWLDYLQALEKFGRLQDFRPVLNRALRALPITQHFRLWDTLFSKLIPKYSLKMPTWTKSFWERHLQVFPEKRIEFIKYLKRIEDWDGAARELVTLANSLMKSPSDLKDEFIIKNEGDEDDAFDSENDDDDDGDDEYNNNTITSITAQKCWTSLCQLIMDHSHEIHSIPVEDILRTAISIYKRQQGRFWTALATFHIRRGYFDAARLVFEEACAKVFLVRDFAQIFDSYAKMEETLLEIAIERGMKKTRGGKKRKEGGEKIMQEDVASDNQDYTKSTQNISKKTEDSAINGDIIIQMANLQSLLDRHAFLLSDVLLRQNPHSVDEWLKRISLVRERSSDGVEAVVAAFEDALRTVNPRKGPIHRLWIELAAFLEFKGLFDAARQVFSRACESDFASSEDLADVFIAAAELEFRLDRQERGLEIISSALSNQKPAFSNSEAWNGLGRCLRLWNFLIDAEEARGGPAACEAAYERLMQLRLTQPQHIINYALFREEVLQDLEGAFRVYERGIELFSYPVAFEIWNIYLPKFVAKYAASRLERTRDLFESALQGCPQKFALSLVLMYAKVEEDYGLMRRALSVYRRGCRELVAPDDRPQLYHLLIEKTVESQGALEARPLYEEAIRNLPFPQSLPFALAHSALEEKLGEVARARALLMHIAQFCDPRAYEDTFWRQWQEFETRRGDEGSFREMLRVKRSVANLFIQKLPFVPAKSVNNNSAKSATFDDDNSIPLVEQNDEEIQLDL